MEQLKKLNKKLKVGQILYSYSLEEFTIDTVGNKYFTVKEMHNRKFFIDTLKMNTDSTPLQLYSDKQILLDMKERDSLYNKIKKRFPVYGSSQDKPSLYQLREIDKILNNPNAEQLLQETGEGREEKKIFSCKCGYKTSDSAAWCIHADCCANS